MVVHCLVSNNCNSEVTNNSVDQVDLILGVVFKISFDQLKWFTSANLTENKIARLIGLTVNWFWVQSDTEQANGNVTVYDGGSYCKQPS